MAENNRPPPPPPSCKPPPTITLPPRNSIHNLFTGGPEVSPGPMSLVSSFFSENDPENDCQSFSQLLAGAMSSPGGLCDVRQDLESGGGGDFMFQQNRPAGIVATQAPGMFTIPPELSPTSLLQLPGMFSLSQGSTAHQPILSQVTGQAQSQPHAQKQLHSEYTSLSTALHQPIQDQRMNGSFDMPLSDQKSQPLNFAVDKPADDGYNWRKYGQKQVKGSEFPRSYYKCTHLNCPVKKKVERSLDGQITEIIYKGQHNHPAPNNKRGKEGTLNGHAHGNTVWEGPSGNLNIPKEESSQVTPEHVSGSSDSEEVGNNVETRVDGRDEDEPQSKRRNVEVQSSEHATNHRTVTEPRIIVQTTSEVDLLDDGYRWRKYGQKVVKGNPHPRSYYKCTTAGCNVRKHIERAASDPKAVITTYEGKHNHDVPIAKNSSHNTGSIQLRPQVERPIANMRTEFGKNKRQPTVALLQFKEEQNMAFL